MATTPPDLTTLSDRMDALLTLFTNQNLTFLAAIDDIQAVIGTHAPATVGTINTRINTLQSSITDILTALSFKEENSYRNTANGYAALSSFNLVLPNITGTMHSGVTNAATAPRTWTFQDKTYTIAGLDDITGTNSGTNTGDETATRIGNLINTAPLKVLPSSNDYFGYYDSVGATMVKFSEANFISWLNDGILTDYVTNTVLVNNLADYVLRTDLSAYVTNTGLTIALGNIGLVTTERPIINQTGPVLNVTNITGTAIIVCDCTANNILLNLPTAVNNFVTLIIKKNDPSVNFVTIAGLGAETIDGSNSISIRLQYESITIISNGTTWGII